MRRVEAQRSEKLSTTSGAELSTKRAQRALVHQARPARRPMRYVQTLVILVLLAMLINTLLTNPRFQWPLVASYMTAPAILSGLRTTLTLTAIAMTIGTIIGTISAVSWMSSNPLLSGLSALFVWAFRGTPELVQLIIWYNLASLYPELSIGIPFGPEIASADTNELITPIMAAFLGLSLNVAAYMSEIIRGGILAVDPGQTAAALSVGMTPLRTMRRIVLPQAIRVIIPATGNRLISLLKYSSLVSVLAVPELLYSVRQIYSVNFRVIPLLFVATIWYLIVVSVLMIGQHYLERHFARTSGFAVRPDPFRQLVQRVLAKTARA